MYMEYWSIKLWCANWISKWVRSNRNNPPGPRALLCTLPTPAVIAKSWKFAENHKAVYDCCLEINFSSHKLVLCFGNWFFWSLENRHVISVFELFWRNLCLGLRRKQLWWRVDTKGCVTGRAEQISNDLCWKWVPQWLGPNFPRWGTHPVTHLLPPLSQQLPGETCSQRAPSTAHTARTEHVTYEHWTCTWSTQKHYTPYCHTHSHITTQESQGPKAQGYVWLWVSEQGGELNPLSFRLKCSTN